MFRIFIACEAREARLRIARLLRLGDALCYACKIRGPIRMHMQLTWRGCTWACALKSALSRVDTAAFRAGTRGDLKFPTKWDIPPATQTSPDGFTMALKKCDIGLHRETTVSLKCLFGGGKRERGGYVRAYVHICTLGRSISTRVELCSAIITLTLSLILLCRASLDPINLIRMYDKLKLTPKTLICFSIRIDLSLHRNTATCCIAIA